MTPEPLQGDGARPLLVFPHISKTGGTTLLYHFRKGFGDAAICSYGEFNRCNRFFEGKPQFEELSAAMINQHRVIQGHGIDEDILGRIANPDIRLIAILRHPVRLARSRFNHRVEQMKLRGKPVSEEDFIANVATNQLSDFYCQRFAEFIDDPTASRQEQTISVLRKFHYVFTTEMLDAQTPGLMQDLGLPSELERRRVAESNHVLSVSDSVLEEANRADIEVFKQANRLAATSGLHNPFGFDKKGFKQAHARLRKRHRERDPSRERRDCYVRLANALCMELRAEAAIAHLETGPVSFVNQARFAKILLNQWGKAQPGLTPEQARLSAENLEKWRANRQQPTAEQQDEEE